MRTQTAKVLGCISLLISIPGVVLPLSITFVEPIEQYLTAALHLEVLAEEDLVSVDLLVYPAFFLPTNITALVLGIFARCSKLGKAGIIVSSLGILVPIGAGIAVLMVVIVLLIGPPVIPYH